ncbi:MAG TPA: hypothetical protein PLI09_15850 [Candidatus Hydrogenedentes bacterium]|nr:hypothetical protein [Candidatus Hydrogenedentota bacterium]
MKHFITKISETALNNSDGANQKNILLSCAPIEPLCLVREGGKDAIVVKRLDGASLGYLNDHVSDSISFEQSRGKAVTAYFAELADGPSEGTYDAKILVLVSDAECPQVDLETLLKNTDKRVERKRYSSSRPRLSLGAGQIFIDVLNYSCSLHVSMTLIFWFCIVVLFLGLAYFDVVEPLATDQIDSTPNNAQTLAETPMVPIHTKLKAGMRYSQIIDMIHPKSEKTTTVPAEKGKFTAVCEWTLSGGERLKATFENDKLISWEMLK